MTPEEVKALIEEQKKLIVDFQAKHEELLKGKIGKSDLDEYERKFEARLGEISAAIAKLSPPPASVNEGKVETKAALLNYLRKGYEALSAPERKTMTLGDPATGGYLALPPDIIPEIIKDVILYSPVRQLATVRNTNRESVQQPKRTGNVTAYRVSEVGDRKTATDVTFGLEEVKAPEMYALVKVSIQNLEDTGYDLFSEIQESVSEQMGVKEGTEFISGEMSKGQLEGILTNTSISGFTGVTTTGKILADDLKQLYYALADVYARNSTWLWRRASTLAISLLKETTTGNYLWQPGLRDGSPATVLNRPYVECPDMPAEAASAKAVAFGDFKRGYLAVERVGLEVKRLVELYAENGIIGFQFRRRIGGQVRQAEAIKILTLKA